MKRVLIIYLNNGNLSSQVSKKYILNKVSAEFHEDGKEITRRTPLGVSLDSEMITYDDDSRILIAPFCTSQVGRRFTHIYIDEACFDLPRGEDLIKGAYLSSLIKDNHSESYHDWDLEGERAFTFSQTDNDISIKAYEG